MAETRVDVKPRSRDVTDGMQKAPARAMLRAIGMTDDDWQKPQVAVASACFVFNAAVSGEFNYQGGERKYMVNHFVFESPQATWDAIGGGVSTDTSTPQEVLTSNEAPTRFGLNVEYFLLGRHFGFLPYFFTGAVAIVCLLLSRTRRDAWRRRTCREGSPVFLRGRTWHFPQSIW